MLKNLDEKKNIRHPEKINKPDNISPSKPNWLKVRAPIGKIFDETKGLLDDLGIVTVCEEASCPNIGNCWSKKHATMMIMGDTCTRACSFCNVATGKPKGLDLTEPFRVAQSVAKLNLNHVVITSVDRDDLDDGGAEHFVNTIKDIKSLSPNTSIEILTPDFLRKDGALEKVIDAKPDVFNHNLETVPRLYTSVRPGARYFRPSSNVGYALPIAQLLPISELMIAFLGSDAVIARHAIRGLIFSGSRDRARLFQLVPGSSSSCVREVNSCAHDDFVCATSDLRTSRALSPAVGVRRSRSDCATFFASPTIPTLTDLVNPMGSGLIST